MPKLIDAKVENGTTTKIAFDGHGKDRKLLVKTEQDIDPLLRQNAELRTMGSVKGTDNQTHFRVVADIPKAIYLSWKSLYGFDIFSAERSNWGMGMTREQHKRFLRSLINATPALKTVDERL
jgi:hypothetical protein